MAKVKHVQVTTPSEALGNKSTIVAGRNYEMEEAEYGVAVLSKATNKLAVIPYANIKSYELFIEPPKAPKTNKVPVPAKE